MRWPGSKGLAQLAALELREDDCSYVWNIEVEKRCLWIQETEDCKVDTIIAYPTMLFCTFGTENLILFALGVILLFLWIFYLFLILGTTADVFFCPSLSTIASVMRLSENIAGVTILAFGNGSPDIFTSLVSNENERLMMFTELIGAGVFVTAFIAGFVVFYSPCTLNPKLFIRDTSFYMLSICWICFIIWDNVVHLWEAMGCVCIYIMFIIVVILMQEIENKRDFRKRRIPTLRDAEAVRVFVENREDEVTWQIPRRSRPYDLRAKLDVAIERELEREQVRKGELPSTESRTFSEFERPRGLFSEFWYDTNPINRNEWQSSSAMAKILLLLRVPLMVLLQLFVPVVNETSEKRGWSKLLNCFQIAFTPIVSLFILNLEDIKFGVVPLIAICFGCTSTIAIVVFILTSVDRIPKYHNALAFIGFLTAMLVVYSVAQEVMAALQCIGFASGISDAMLGITLLAWGNSVGDLISNVTIARKGFPRMGFAACFGGPMFNTLMGLGLTYGISAARSDDLRIRVRTSNMAPGCLAFLLGSLFSSFVYLNTTGFIGRRSYSYLLFTIYGTFLLINVLSETHFMHPLGNDHRPDNVV